MASSVSADISTTGTTRMTFVRWNRNTSPRWTAAISPAHLIVLGNVCREIVSTPVTGLGWLAGIDDALEITRESLRGLPDDRRTLSVTRKHLEDALDALSAAVSASLRSARDPAFMPKRTRCGKSFGRAPATPAGLIARLAELALHADTLADIARTFSAERGDEASAEVLACAEAVNASVQSHQRDFEQLMPWAKLLADEATPLGMRPRTFLRSRRLRGSSMSVPTLADLPNRCEAAMLHTLTQQPGGACLRETAPRA